MNFEVHDSWADKLKLGMGDSRAEVPILIILCIILFRISWKKLALCSKTYALFSKLFQ